MTFPDERVKRQVMKDETKAREALDRWRTAISNGETIPLWEGAAVWLESREIGDWVRHEADELMLVSEGDE